MTSTRQSNAHSSLGLPLVVQVAFAGKRRLLSPDHAATIDLAAFHTQLTALLTARLRQLPAELALTPQHKICTLSSLAAGSDLFFTNACASLGWSQRILLPQALEDFLTAQGSSEPDFSPEEANEARRLLASPHIIEERVVSLSADRHVRFEDVNLEMVRVCDVLVCLLPAEASEDKRAGTRATLNLATRWHRPVLELRVTLQDDGSPTLTEQWHWPKTQDSNADAASRFVPPALPSPLDQIENAIHDLKDGDTYRKTLKAFCSLFAKQQQTFFKAAALVIVGTHVIATALALLALKLPGDMALRWLLGAEIFFLAAGLGLPSMAAPLPHRAPVGHGPPQRRSCTIDDLAGRGGCAPRLAFFLRSAHACLASPSAAHPECAAYY